MNNNLRFHLWTTYKKCFVCGIEIEDYADSSIEHIIPISKGGEKFSLKNLSISHKVCNWAKGNSTNPDEWMQNLKELKSAEPRARKLRSFGPTLTLSKVNLIECFSHIPDLLYIIQTQLFDDKLLKPHKKNNQLIASINKLQSFETTEELILFIDRNHDQISKDWRIIFSMCFLERFILNQERTALLNVLINLKLYEPNSENPFRCLIDSIFKFCETIDPELCYKYQKGLLYEELL